MITVGPSSFLDKPRQEKVTLKQRGQKERRGQDGQAKRGPTRQVTQHQPTWHLWSNHSSYFQIPGTNSVFGDSCKGRWMYTDRCKSSWPTQTQAQVFRDSIPQSTITRVPYYSLSKIPSQWLSVQGQPPRYKASATSQQMYLRDVALWVWLQGFLYKGWNYSPSFYSSWPLIMTPQVSPKKEASEAGMITRVT